MMTLAQKRGVLAMRRAIEVADTETQKLCRRKPSQKTLRDPVEAITITASWPPGLLAAVVTVFVTASALWQMSKVHTRRLASHSEWSDMEVQ